MTGSFVSRHLPGILGVALFCVAWEVIGTWKLAGLSWPPLSTVLKYVSTPTNQPLLLRASLASFTSVAIGYVIGTLTGFALTALVRMITGARVGIDRFVAMVHATPGIALAPVFMIFLDRDQVPKAIAILSVFYIMYIAATSGLEAVRAPHRDLFQTLGARGTTRFLRLELPTAIPAIVSGLKLAVPVSFMGTIVGEWFGASRGLGILMVSAMQNFQIPLLWAAVLLTLVPCLAFYLLMGYLESIAYRRFT